MPAPITTIGSFQIPTYAFALLVAFAASTVWTAYQTRANRLGALTDVSIAALLGAVVGARLEHVVVNWAYFSTNTSEIWRLASGGLDWHGAVIGGLLALLVTARLRGVAVSDVLPVLAPVPTLVAVAGWWGCWSAGCAYGAEVDTLARYPALVVAESRDVFGIVAPRYNAQLLGTLLALVLFAIGVLLVQRNWLRNSRFWLMLALVSLSIFGVGFIRGDFSPLFGGLRLDQWLDLTICGAALVMILVRKRQNETPEADFS